MAFDYTFREYIYSGIQKDTSGEKPMNTKFGQRRIVRVNATRRVSIPREWLDTVGLKDGDVVELEMDGDGNLILRPQKGGGDATKVQ